MENAEGLARDGDGALGSVDTELRPLTVLFVSVDTSWSRPFRRALVRRGAKAIVAPGIREAERLAELVPPDVLVVGDPFAGELSQQTLHLARRQTPVSEVIVLGANEDRPELSNVGLGLLYSGRRSAGPDLLLEVLDRAFPRRLSSTPQESVVEPLIVCVDDDRLFLNSLARMIRRHGYRVASFPEGPTALEAIQDLRPSVAVVDLSMPGMDGFALTRAISSRYGNRLPVVLLTGRESSSDMLAGYGQGASYFVAKSSPPVRVLRILDYLAGSLDEEERRRLETLL